MKLLYKPFGLIAGLIAARIGRGLFKSMWARVDRRDPPDPTEPEAAMSKVVGAAALEAATMAGVAAAADRVAAQAFHHLTGIWPGKPAEKKSGKRGKKDGKRGKKDGKRAEKKQDA